MSKTAIVTGASGGIGSEIAKRLAADGFSVVLQYQGKSEKADEAVKQIKDAAGKAIAVKGDLTNEKDVVQLFERTLSAFDQVDVVVHSAGIMPLSPIIKNDVDLFDKVIATNLRSTFLVLAQAAKQVQDGGRIMAL